MSGLWAYCDPCGRWFYPELSAAVANAAPPCPVCSTQALTLTERPEAAPA